MLVKTLKRDVQDGPKSAQEKDAFDRFWRAMSTGEELDKEHERRMAKFDFYEGPGRVSWRTWK